MQSEKHEKTTGTASSQKVFIPRSRINNPSTPSPAQPPAPDPARETEKHAPENAYSAPTLDQANQPAPNKSSTTPLRKKWWFWAIIVVILFSMCDKPDPEPDTELAKAGVTLYPRKVRNDNTGNWKVCTMASSVNICDYAIDYYNTYFEDSSEIHFVVNFSYRTTTVIRNLGDRLSVSILEYEEDEEHDAKKLGGGMFLKEYHVFFSTGEMELVQTYQAP